jgi:hypothetical protein
MDNLRHRKKGQLPCPEGVALPLAIRRQLLKKAPQSTPRP